MNNIDYHPNDELFRIREVSDIFGIPVETLRYYHNIGLIEPQRNRENNYRRFDLQTMTCLHTVRMLRTAGVPIEHIKDWFDAPTMERLLSVLEETHLQTQERIKSLMNQQENFFALYAKLNHMERHPNRILLRESPDFWLYYRDPDCRYAELQKKMTEAQNKQSALPSSIFRMQKDQLDETERCYCEYMIGFEKKWEGAPKQPDIHSSLCAYSVFSGNQFKELSGTYDRMSAWIREHSFTVTGDILEVYIAGTNDLDILEIWIPIRE